MYSRLTIAAAILAGSLLATPSYAASTGWIDANDLKKFSSSVLRRQKQMPTSMKCRNSNNAKGMSRKNTMVNVTYRPLQKGVKWSWAWGSRVATNDRRLKRKGYKRVSFDSFRRPSGLLIRCAIWHKAG